MDKQAQVEKPSYDSNGKSVVTDKNNNKTMN